MKIHCVRSGLRVSKPASRLVRGTASPRSLLLAATLLTALVGLAATAALLADEGLPPVAASSDSTASLPGGLRDGLITEKATDLTVPGPRFSWTQERSYSSSRISGNSTMGGAWTSSNADCRLTPGKDNAVTLLNGTNSTTFSFRDGKYSGPKSSKLTLKKLPGSQDGPLFQVTDAARDKIQIFYGLAGPNAGLLKETTTRGWLAQGLAGTHYA